MDPHNLVHPPRSRVLEWSALLCPVFRKERIAMLLGSRFEFSSHLDRTRGQRQSKTLSAEFNPVRSSLIGIGTSILQLRMSIG